MLDAAALEKRIPLWVKHVVSMGDRVVPFGRQAVAETISHAENVQYHEIRCRGHFRFADGVFDDNLVVTKTYSQEIGLWLWPVS